MNRIKIAAVCAAALMVLCLGALAGCGPNDEEVIRKAIRDAGYLPLRTKEKV